MRRHIAAALLLLAISPVTAPFLTFDLSHLLSGDVPIATATVADSKKVNDVWLDAAAVPAVAPLLATRSAVSVVPQNPIGALRPAISLPLRI